MMQLETMTQANYNIMNWGTIHPVRYFLNEQKEGKSRDEYERVILQFFNTVFKVNGIEEITGDMLRMVNSVVVMQYRDKMFKVYVSSTVHNYIKKLKTLYDFLTGITTDNVTGKQVFLNNPFNIMVKNQEDTSNYGTLTVDQVKALIEVGDYQARVFYELATTISMRKNAILNLKLDDFRQLGNIWVVDTVDKGKEFQNSIPHNLYNKLIEVSEVNSRYSNNDNRIFKMDDSTIYRKFKADCKKIGLSAEYIKENKITVHSLRSASADMAFALNEGDLQKTKEHTNHSSIEMLSNRYLGKNRDFENAVSLQINEKLNKNDDSQTVKGKLYSRLEDMSKEEIIEVMMNMSSSFKVEMLDRIDG